MEASRSTARLILIATTVGAAGILGTALAFQYIGGLQPCQLCYWQRIPYWIGIPIGFLAAAAWPRLNLKLRRAASSLLCLVFLVGAGLGAHHMGVEQGWWPGPASCSSTDFSGSIDELIDQIMAAPVIRCDDIPWSLFGLSMATYNMVLSAILAGLCLIAAQQPKRRPYFG